MYLAKGMDKAATLITFGIAGFVMIAGYILISALCGSLVRYVEDKLIVLSESYGHLCAVCLRND